MPSTLRSPSDGQLAASWDHLRPVATRVVGTACMTRPDETVGTPGSWSRQLDQPAGSVRPMALLLCAPVERRQNQAKMRERARDNAGVRLWHEGRTDA